MKKQYFFLAVMSISIIRAEPWQTWLPWNWWQEQQEEERVTKKYEINQHSTINFHGIRGNLTVRTHTHPMIMIEAVKRGPLLDLRATTIHTKISADEVFITTKQSDDSVEVDYILVVPEHASLVLQQDDGDIQVKNIKGSADIFAKHGNVYASAYDSISIKAPHGKAHIDQKQLPVTSSVFVQAGLGIDFAVSPNVNAHLYAKTLNGKIRTQGAMYLNLDSFITQLNEDLWKRIKKDIKATIGIGGAPITLEVTKGDIVIAAL